jgi:hypothetical protein
MGTAEVTGQANGKAVKGRGGGVAKFLNVKLSLYLIKHYALED